MKNPAVFKRSALKRVQGIHRLSVRYNRRVQKPHQERLLELMRHHVDEVEELIAKNDPHALVETGDLLVLCLELLLENKVLPDVILERCFGRYERKLGGLLAELKPERKPSRRRQN